ncbi:MAG: PAS domain-containing sensor histidine kinase [Ignavibacteriales bacterium]|nr:PAS domain-containing sensor histidine kinase [Ignavibacteriales bacterium]
MAQLNSHIEFTDYYDSDFRSYIELPNNNPLVVFDTELKIVYCNKIFKDTFGLDQFLDINQMNSNPEFVYLIRGFSESQYKNLTLEIDLASKNYEGIKNYAIKIERVVIRYNHYYVVIIESLEQRKKLENKITFLYNALDYGQLPLMIIDEDQKVNYVSRSWEAILSQDIESIYNKNLIQIFQNILDDGELAELNESIKMNRPWKKLFYFPNKLSSEYWELNLNPVYNNEESKASFIITGSNLTEHINQAKLIENSERKQKLIINNISDLLLIVENIGIGVIFENANDNFCWVFDINRYEIYSHKIENIIPHALYSEIQKSIDYLSQPDTLCYQFNYKNVDGREYDCKITSIRENELNFGYYIVTMKDTTDEILYREQLKKSIQKEMQLNKMKSDFLANMSHEIRTPFNAVVGFSEIIDESIETGKIEILRDLIDSMKEVLHRGLNLFTNIIEVSQLEAGEVLLDKVDLNCNQVVRNVYQRMQKEAVQKNLDFLLNITDEDSIAEVDWVKLERIIQMLVDNAFKYTNKGCICLETKVINDNIVISVSDTGLGIEKSQIERLLKPFTQEVEGYTRSFEGAGLGLTIAYKLTLLMDGKFEIESEKNKGTKITISFHLS